MEEQTKNRPSKPQPEAADLLQSQWVSQTFSEAVAFHGANRLQEAECLYHNILSIDPKHYDALSMLGALFFQLGKREEGVKLIEQSLAINPKQPLALNNLGVVFQDLAQYKKALYYYNKSLILQPHNVRYYNNRGNVRHLLKDYKGALDDFNKALSLDAKYADAYNNRGTLLCELKRYEEAALDYEKALILQPEQVAFYENQAKALMALQRYAEALQALNKVIAFNPHDAGVYNNRGNVRRILGDYNGALDDLNKAILFNPGCADAYNNRGITLCELKRCEEALGDFEQAIVLNPNGCDAYSNRGTLLSKWKRYEEALRDYEQAIALNANYAEAHWNKALLKLLLGNYEEGWKFYEWRWKTILKEHANKFLQPLWLGKESLKDKTIFLHAEQGFGDMIQFCRYVPMVEALGAKVMLGVPKDLSKLVSSLEGTFQIIEDAKLAAECDYRCPLMSLPLAFKTTLETIPAGTYLYADPVKKSQWQEILGVKIKPRIGIVWSGSKEHKNDHERSIPFDTFSKLFSPALRARFDFHCLQKEIREEDQGLLSGFPVKTHMDNLHDFADTAALVSEMDLVISIDTSVVHVAGALGKPVWVLLPFNPDFRWLLEREDSPWYPTARLFRQSKINDWESVLETVRLALTQYDSLIKG